MPRKKAEKAESAAAAPAEVIEVAKEKAVRKGKTSATAKKVTKNDDKEVVAEVVAEVAVKKGRKRKSDDVAEEDKPAAASAAPADADAMETDEAPKKGKKKAAKAKTAKGKEAAEEVGEASSNKASKKKSAKGKKGKADADDEGEEAEGDEEAVKQPKKKKARKAENSVANTDLVLKPVTPRVPNTIKIVSWNVNSLNSVQEHDRLADYIRAENPDIVCLQETKCSEGNEPTGVMEGLPFEYFSCSIDKKGYAGTATFSKTRPINVTFQVGGAHDGEGRVVTCEFENFFLVNTYIPNSGMKLERLKYRTEEWDKDFLKYLKKLEQTKPVVWCGDLNVSPQDIDVYAPKKLTKTAGFTPKERANHVALLGAGFVDTYRVFHPDEAEYSFWSYRSNARPVNNGWRLDHFIVSQSLMDRVGESVIRTNVMGSDHAPIVLFLAA